MLSDNDILTEIRTGINLQIERFDESCLSPVGYDVRAGETVFSLKKKKIISLDAGEIEIKPKETVFISSFETFKLSKNIGGISISRLGPQLDSIFCTALPVDPTWSGKLLIILTNHGRKKYKVKYKDRLMTVCFHRMDSPSIKDISRIRWDNDNIKEKFREMERDSTKIKNKLLAIDVVVLTVLCVSLYALWKFSFINDFVNVLSLAIAAMAIYFSSIRKEIE